MSAVTLLCADRPLPLYDPEQRRVSRSRGISVETPGFSVQAHEYYRDAVDSLGLALKPWQYELDVEATEADSEQLRIYLSANCRSGEQVELWRLWVGDDREETFPHYRGRLADLDRAALELLCNPPPRNGCPGQCRLTVTI